MPQGCLPLSGICPKSRRADCQAAPFLHALIAALKATTSALAHTSCKRLGALGTCFPLLPDEFFYYLLEPMAVEPRSLCRASPSCLGPFSRRLEASEASEPQCAEFRGAEDMVASTRSYVVQIKFRFKGSLKKCLAFAWLSPWLHCEDIPSRAFV